MVALPGLTLGQAAVNNQTTTSIANTVPVVGGALSAGVSYAMLGSGGFSMAAITLMTVLTGIWNAFLKLAMPIAGLQELPERVGAQLRHWSRSCCWWMGGHQATRLPTG